MGSRAATSGLAALVLVAAVPAGCGGEEARTGGVAGVQTVRTKTAERGGWATKPELAWLRKVAAWSAGFVEAGERVSRFETDGSRFQAVLRGDEDAVAQYRELLEPIRDCPDSFAREVGPAPTERLRDSARNFRESCRHFRRGVDLLLDAVDEQDEGLADRAQYQMIEAGKEASVASGSLPPGEKQALPTAGGEKVSGSRIDPRYSEAVSAITDKDVEVRCWSRADWRRLIVEEKTFTRGKVNERVLGFASPGGGRINLAPMTCHNLDRVAYGGARPGGERDRYALALALVTLAHEGAHAAGVADEPTAECHGIQTASEAARRMGIERAFTDELVRLYWRNYPKLPPMYRSDECREGGKLDLEEGERNFPER